MGTRRVRQTGRAAYVRRAACAAIVIVAIGACGTDDPPEIDPSATYDAYGHPFEPAPAMAVEAVLAEAARYDSAAMMIEGVLRDDCASEDCWFVMHADTSRLVIVTPTFDVADDVAGRRAVVHGRFTRTDTTYTLNPTGVMVEKVRS